ncbi:MAG: L,D-transpeptidase family protein [Methylococcaceae bacterium]|nr:L,D-transpeptidase family protein [Methylococcaceae bacterium]
MPKILFCLIFTLLITPVSFAEPFWGSKVSQPVNTPSNKLKAGQFIWKGDIAPAGPTVAEINLAEQRFYLYRNGVLIGLSTASTGKGRRSTPTGIFSVLTKIRHHRSRKYNNAPMPYTQHINNTGIAMHAGKLPGYPASHGCIRLPSAFARLLFKSSFIGMPVVISREKNSAAASIKAGVLSTNEPFRWQPEKASLGAASIVMSKADQRIFVYRNGVEIGRAKLSLTNMDKSFGTHAYLLHQGEGDSINPFLNHDVSSAWVTIKLPKSLKQKQAILKGGLLQNLQIPASFSTAVNEVLTSGTSLYITDSSVLEHEITALALNAVAGNQQKQALAVPSKTPIAKVDEWSSVAALAEIENLQVDMKDMQKQVEKIKSELSSIEKLL